MKDILIFSHNYLVNQWFEIVQEQLTLLVDKGLYKTAKQIYYSCFSEQEDQIHKFITLIKKIDIDKKIFIYINPYNDKEKQTIVLLQKICKSHQDSYVLYFHTKGVTYTSEDKIKNYPDLCKNVKSWRDILNHFNIEKWQCWVQALDNNHDTAGALYGSFSINGIDGYRNFYAGNFWWAKASHINKLPNAEQLDNYQDMEHFVTSIIHTWARPIIPIEGDIYGIYFDPKDYRKD